MTKKFTTVVSHRFANHGLSLRIPLETVVDGSFVWNLEFESLGIGWDLVFDSWNFLIFIKQVFFLKSINYIIK